MSLKRIADSGQIRRRKKRVTLHLTNGKTLFGLSVGKLNYLSGFRRPLDSSNFALATIAPGNIPCVSPVDTNTFHVPLGHIHENYTAPQPNRSNLFMRGS